MAAISRAWPARSRWSSSCKILRHPLKPDLRIHRTRLKDSVRLKPNPRRAHNQLIAGASAGALSWACFTACWYNASKFTGASMRGGKLPRVTRLSMASRA